MFKLIRELEEMGTKLRNGCMNDFVEANEMFLQSSG